MGDGKGSVAGSDHLREAAGFEGRGHEDEVRAAISDVREGFGEGVDGDAVLEAVVFHDATEVLLIRSIGNHDNLQAKVGVVLSELVEDVGEELAAFLDGVEA